MSSFKSLRTNLSPAGRSQFADPHFGNLREAAGHFEDHRDPLEWVNDRLGHLDLGLSGVRITKRKAVLNELMNALGIVA